MIGRRAVIGLSLLSMLVFCAVAAPSAFATKGTTAFTCVKGTANEGFEDAHCNTFTKIKEKVKFVHSEIKPGVETPVTVSNKNTANNTTEHTDATLEATVFGNKAIVTCTEVHGTGFLLNSVGPPMKVSGTISVEFSNCTATLGGKACESVNEGKPIKTKALVSNPAEVDELEFKEHGEAFAKFNIKCAGKNNEINVKGSATGIPEGATLKFTDASTTGDKLCKGNGLCVGGQPAKFEALLTTTMSTTEPGIALTTNP